MLYKSLKTRKNHQNIIEHGVEVVTFASERPQVMQEVYSILEDTFAQIKSMGLIDMYVP